MTGEPLQPASWLTNVDQHPPSFGPEAREDTLELGVAAAAGRAEDLTGHALAPHVHGGSVGKGLSGEDGDVLPVGRIPVREHQDAKQAMTSGDGRFGKNPHAFW